MDTPASFIPDQQAQSAPSSFIPDKPSSFIPDSGAVLNKNTTGFPLQPALGPEPQSYGDAMAMKSPMNVQEPGIRSTISDAANAPLTLLGQVAAGLLNQMADKSSPDFQQAGSYPNASHYRDALAQRLFGPSNLAVLGKDPNQQMFQQGRSLLPMETSVVGADSDARRIAEGMTTPEGLASAAIAPTKLGPLVTGMYGASTAAALPDMKPADLMANAIMMGLPMARGLHEAIAPTDISRSAPMVKEVPPVEIPNDKLALPKSTTDLNVPEGGDSNMNTGKIVPSVSRGTLPPDLLGKEMGLTVKKWDDSIPVLGGSYSLTDPKTGFTVENLRDGVTKEEVQQRLDAKQKEVSELFGNQKMGDESGSVGLHVLDPEVWKELGFKAKTEGQQFINRLRNKLGGDSAGWKMIDTPELKSFMQEPRTTQEVQDFVNKNGPKVEVRKFGQGSMTTPEQRRFAELEHQIDSHPEKKLIDKVLTYEESTDYDKLSDGAKKIVDEFRPLNKVDLHKGVEESHWQTVAPKSEKDMLGYTEIVVVKPVKQTRRYPDMKSDTQMVEHPQFPSSHSFPPNTLGFVRGYMETTPQGKKVFHVIEVQSDWAQQLRDLQNSPDFAGARGEGVTPTQNVNYARKVLGLQDPLLPHYERLALKAAIDHAREQGADSIAISDAETAMMTERHDQQGGQKTESDIPQASGMRLHYDPSTLLLSPEGSIVERFPSSDDAQRYAKYNKLSIGTKDTDYKITKGSLHSIAEELTGEKGTKESFGEHRMALLDPGDISLTWRAGQHIVRNREGEERSFDTREKAEEMQKTWARPNLIFRNESGEPKTDITARVYPISKAAKDFSIIGKDKPAKQVGNQGVSGESGMVDLSGAKESLDKAIEGVKEFFSDEGIRRKTMQMARVSVPKTTAANESVGNQLTMFAQSEGVAEALARSKASEVLGSHWKDSEFANKLGAVGVEDQLRTLKAQLLAQGKTAEAQSVNTLVGQPYSPIKSEAQYQQLKSAHEIVAALDRHKQIIQPLAEVKQTALKGALRAPGQDTGAFFNLIAKGVDDGEIKKARQGNQLATLKGGTRFGKEFKGTAAEYETDYRKMAERMVKGNYSEVEKQKLFDLVDSTGFGHLQKTGEDLPTFDKPMSPIPVQRRIAVIVKPGEKPIMKNQNETLWVPKRSEEEFRQAFQTDSPLKSSLLQGIGKLVTGIQTAAGADAAIHVGNMAAAIVTSPEKATAVKLAFKNLAATFESNPEVQKRLASMAEEAGIVRQGENEVSGWKKLIPGRNMISWVDQAGRLTLDQLYKDAVARGESPDNAIYRRAAVQGTLGEYNKRLMPKLQQAMKELGISPFLTAGKTLNALSLRQLVLSPSRKAVDLQGGAKMRLKQALYATGLIVAAPMIINKAMTGTPFPKGVQPGQFVIKKNDDGSYVVGDIAKLLMWRRGLRNSGIQAVAKGIEDKQSVGQIAMQAGKDIGRGLAHPLAGPLVSTADTALGSGILTDRPAKPIGGRLVDAAKQLNPTAAMLLDSNPNKTTGEKVISGVGRVAGLSITQNNNSRISGLAHQWMERNGVSVGNEPAGPYGALTAALKKNDASAARQAVGELIAAGKSDKEIKEYYKNIPERNFTDSRKHEDAFVASLGDDDKQVYQKVKSDNKQVRDRFYQIFLPNAPIPRDPMPRMPQRESMPSRFPLKR